MELAGEKQMFMLAAVEAPTAVIGIPRFVSLSAWVLSLLAQLIKVVFVWYRPGLISRRACILRPVRYDMLRRACMQEYPTICFWCSSCSPPTASHLCVRWR